MGWGFGGVEMVKLVIFQHLGVKSSVGRSLSRSAVRREFVRIGDEGGGPSGHQMDRIHGGNISPARQFMRLRSGSVGSDTVRLGLPKKGTPADYLNGICGILCDTGFIDWLGHERCWGGGSMQCASWFEVGTHTRGTPSINGNHMGFG